MTLKMLSLGYSKNFESKFGNYLGRIDLQIYSILDLFVVFEKIVGCLKNGHIDCWRCGTKLVIKDGGLHRGTN